MSPDTIFAPSTGAGPAGVCVIRLSGPGAAAALRRLTGTLTAPRRLVRARVTDGASGEVIDDGLAVWMPGPASYTGEDTAELHVHGGRATVAAVLDALAACPGLRPAEAGEFTRRAFENGKMDLTAAEGLADLVAAETAAQRRQALRQLGGDLGRLYENWRHKLLAALAHQEATIDFSDEDLPEEIDTKVRLEVAALDCRIADHLADGGVGERLRAGTQVVIMGPPNVGKSSLLNLLAGLDAAIVSDSAGTTRDVIEVHMDLGGYPVTVADTAGLGDSDDEVEREGVRRARRRAGDADLKLAVFDAPSWPDVDDETAGLVDADTVVAINKADLAMPKPPLSIGGRPAHAVSVLTGDGVDALVAALEDEVAAHWSVSAQPLLTRQRHRQALEECRAGLGRFLAADAPELAAEDLRLAARALGRITGRVGVEDMLDIIFRDFCIGK
ncbi:MAG: tRNA uridine-5-carboxymethylaminomethyl(34) synthesis GTPase MnmE [Rhodospirillales bacterium]|nr:tRNA uridine-5-carboxymethylaminomethyl(34) synthesis GTPase MnmE [Rhodospirillales bacterium]